MTRLEAIRARLEAMGRSYKDEADCKRAEDDWRIYHRDDLRYLLDRIVEREAQIIELLKRLRLLLAVAAAARQISRIEDRCAAFYGEDDFQPTIDKLNAALAALDHQQVGRRKP